MKKKAFTLAEVLITLGIIGVVAALVMPSLIANYRKQQTISQLKKVYSTLNNAMRMSEAENGDYASWDVASDIGIQNYFDKYWKPYFNITEICQKSYCWYSSDVPWFDYDGNPNTTGAGTNSYGVSFKLADGTMINLRALAGNASVSNLVIVDLNGAKSPNTFGKDVFFFERTPQNGVMPYGYDQSDDDVDTNCATSGGYCGAKIIREGWQINYDLK